MPSKVNGIDKVVAGLAALAARLPAETEQFLEREAQTIYDKSQQIVPRDSNELADSGEIVKPGGRLGVGVVRGLLPRDASGRFTRGGITVRYGQKYATDYAAVVHEYSSKMDPPTWRGKLVQFKTGGPRYLSRPFNESVGTIWQRLAAHLRGKL